MNKDVQAVIRDLERRGFTTESDRGGVTLISPNGDRYRPSSNFKAVRAWAEKQLREPRRRDRAERRDGGGTNDAHRASSSFTRRADGVLSHWDRLNHEWKLNVVREMLHRLSRDGDEASSSALRELGG